MRQSLMDVWDAAYREAMVEGDGGDDEKRLIDAKSRKRMRDGFGSGAGWGALAGAFSRHGMVKGGLIGAGLGTAYGGLLADADEDAEGDEYGEATEKEKHSRAMWAAVGGAAPVPFGLGAVAGHRAAGGKSNLKPLLGQWAGSALGGLGGAVAGGPLGYHVGRALGGGAGAYTASRLSDSDDYGEDDEYGEGDDFAHDQTFLIRQPSNPALSIPLKLGGLVGGGAAGYQAAKKFGVGAPGRAAAAIAGSIAGNRLGHMVSSKVAPEKLVALRIRTRDT